MKTFDEIYSELQKQDNRELYTTWKEAKKQNEKTKKIGAVLCLIMDTFFLFLLYKHITTLGSFLFLSFIVFFVLIINLIVFGVITTITKLSSKQSQFNTQYKDLVIKKMIANFYSNVEYFAYKPMPEYIYKQPNYEYYTRYQSDDYFEAQINNQYSIQMAKILTTEVENYEDLDGTTKTRTITKFHGLFAKIVMDQSINSEVRIMPNAKITLGINKVNMDSSEFEKHFDVTASNAIVAMQLLTSDVMEELVEFENKTKMKYDIYIKNNELFLRFYSGPMFEFGNFKKDVFDKDMLHQYFYMLNFTYHLSNRFIRIIKDSQL